MAYSSVNDARNWMAWELDPSTRQSVHLLTKSYPVDKTLTTPGTAEDLVTVAPGIATVNLVTNPSMETSDPPAGYTASGAILSRDNTYAQFGTYSLKIVPGNVVAGEGGYWSLGEMPGRLNEPIPLSLSVYLTRGVGAGDTARIRLYGETSATWINGNTITLDNTWQRSMIETNLTVPQVYRVYLVTAAKHGTAFYADGLQAETLPQVTTYCDGDQGIYNWWDGTSHASTSRRWKKLSCIRSYRLHATRDCYFAFDRNASNTATNAEDRGEYLRAGVDFGEDHPVFLRSRISFINRLSGEQPRIYGTIWGI